MKNVVLFGATSAIARAYAERLLKGGYRFVLVGRNLQKLEKLKAHLQVLDQAVEVEIYVSDFSSDGLVEFFTREFGSKGRKIDQVLVAHGTLPDQHVLESDSAGIETMLHINLTSSVVIVNESVKLMESQQSGEVVVITSVAGDRGRASNYLYGMCKGALSTMLEGVQHRLQGTEIHVMDVRPGFVDTPMTRDFPKGPLWAKPATIAKVIERGLVKKKYVLYAPFFWRSIMRVIRTIPGCIFRRTKL